MASFLRRVRVPMAARKVGRPSTSKVVPKRSNTKVDSVGARAVTIATRAHLSTSAPRVIVSASTIARTSIDPPTAYLLSLMDGKTTLAMLADLQSEKMETMTARGDMLVRLGLVTFEREGA